MISGFWLTAQKKAGRLSSGVFPGSDCQRLSLMMSSSDFDSDGRPARENERGNNLLYKGSSEKKNYRTILKVRLEIITSCSDTGRKMISNHFPNLYLISLHWKLENGSFVFFLFLHGDLEITHFGFLFGQCDGSFISMSFKLKHLRGKCFTSSISC